MNFPEWQGWSVQGPAIGGGIVRRFDRLPEHVFGTAEFRRDTCAVQWLEREGDGGKWVVRATVSVTGEFEWARKCAIEAVFDSFLQKIG